MVYMGADEDRKNINMNNNTQEAKVPVVWGIESIAIRKTLITQLISVDE
jgi:hypothetical protein